MAEKLDLSIRPSGDFFELIVVGRGPAGLMAAVYTAREDISTLVVDQGALGGQAAITEKLENFPAFDEGIGGGPDLADRLGKQARRFGAETLVAQEVKSVFVQDGYKMVTTVLGGRLLLSIYNSDPRVFLQASQCLRRGQIHWGGNTLLRYLRWPLLPG